METKKNRGITVIALIITIILLLILAGVVINITLGNNGILSMAQKSKENYANSETDEKRRLEDLYSSILIATNDDAEVTISLKDLKAFIRDEVQNAVWGESVTPTGTIIAQMGNTAPAGYINCDGATYQISEYKQLAEYIKAQFGNYNYFGGDGENTFAVPDLRGEFLRGTGTASRNTGSGASTGTHQDPTRHMATFTAGGGHISWASIKSFSPNNMDKAVSSTGTRMGVASSATGTWSAQTTGLYTSRPTNTSVLYCIKY